MEDERPVHLGELTEHRLGRCGNGDAHYARRRFRSAWSQRIIHAQKKPSAFGL